MTAEEVIKMLLEHRFSGAPVTDEQGCLKGIISEYRLLEVIFTPELKNAPVSKFMTTDVVTVDEETPLTEIASQFVLHRIRRLPVVRDGRLVGTISRRDLLRQIADSDHVPGKLVAATGPCT
jgi:CBS domain-containing protein